MHYLVLLLAGLMVVIFLVNVKNFDNFLHRVIYVVVGLIIIVGVIVLVQPSEYVKYNTSSEPAKKNRQAKQTKEQITQIQYLALKMKTEGFSEEQIIESFSHEYPSRLDVALQLENAGFSADATPQSAVASGLGAAHSPTSVAGRSRLSRTGGDRTA